MADAKLDEGVGVLEMWDLESEPAGERGAAPTARIAGVVLGRLVGLPSSRRALVTLRGREPAKPMSARRIAGLTREDVGREVALMFEGGDPGRPTIIGLIEPAPGLPRDGDGTVAAGEPLELDAESILLTGEREIVLRCGKASITLTRAGKVLIRGAYLLNRSSGANRIKGGSVQIN